MLNNLIEKTILVSNVTCTSYSESIQLAGIEKFSAQIDVTVLTPAAKEIASTGFDAGTDIITKTAHGFVTGLKVAATTDGTLPAGLSATNYYIIYLTDDTFSIASSLANAIAGTKVNFTDAGAGNHTFTPASLAGGTVTLEKSNDDITYFTEVAAQNITATGSFIVEKEPFMKFYRLKYVVTAGVYSVSNKIVAKG